MKEIMKYYQKRYNLEIVENDGVIEEIYHIVDDKKLKMNKENNKWICKDGNYVFFIPDIK